MVDRGAESTWLFCTFSSRYIQVGGERISVWGHVHPKMLTKTALQAASHALNRLRITGCSSPYLKVISNSVSHTQEKVLFKCF